MRILRHIATLIIFLAGEFLLPTVFPAFRALHIPCPASMPRENCLPICGNVPVATFLTFVISSLLLNAYRDKSHR